MSSSMRHNDGQQQQWQRQRRRRGTTAAAPNAAAANDTDYDDTRRFDRLLDAYFKPPTVTSKRQRSTHTGVAAPPAAAAPQPLRRRTASSIINSASSRSPDTTASTSSQQQLAVTTPSPPPPPLDTTNSLRAIKQSLRLASPAAQTRHTTRLFESVLHAATRVRSSDAAFERVLTLVADVFARSAAFRALVAARAAVLIDHLLTAAGESSSSTSRTQTNRTTSISRQLTAQNQQLHAQNQRLQRVLALLETWRDGFARPYPPLAAAVAALEQRGYVFPHAAKAHAAAAKDAADTQALCRRLRYAALHELEQVAPEIEDVLVEMHRGFALLVPTLDAFDLFADVSAAASSTGESPAAAATGSTVVADDRTLLLATGGMTLDVSTVNSAAWEGDDDDAADAEDDGVEWEDVGESDSYNDQQHDDDANDSGSNDSDARADSQLDMHALAQTYGLGSAAYALTVEVPTGTGGVCAHSRDNDALLRHVADCVLRIRKRFLPLVCDWQQHVQPAADAELSSHTDGSTSISSSTSSDGDAHAVEQRRIDRTLALRVADLQQRLELAVAKWEDLVAESEKQRLAHVASRVVSLPLSTYTPRRAHASDATKAHKRKRTRVVLTDRRGQRSQPHSSRRHCEQHR